MVFWIFKGAKKRTVKEIVRQWEESQVSNITKDIIRMIPERVPFLRDIALNSLSGLINKNLAFSTSEPKEVSDNIYNIIDTVKVKAGGGIPFLGKQFSLSIKYNLEVGMKEKNVVAKPDIGSLKIDFF